MRSSEIFRQAARLIETGPHEFSCNAILKACGNEMNERYDAAISRWEDFLGQHASIALFYEPEDDGRWCDPKAEQRAKDRRVVALCFAADVAKSEGD
jgi:hypothetical protein